MSCQTAGEVGEKCYGPGDEGKGEEEEGRRLPSFCESFTWGEARRLNAVRLYASWSPPVGSAAHRSALRGMSPPPSRYSRFIISVHMAVRFRRKHLDVMKEKHQSFFFFFGVHNRTAHTERNNKSSSLECVASQNIQRTGAS